MFKQDKNEFDKSKSLNYKILFLSLIIVILAVICVEKEPLKETIIVVEKSAECEQKVQRPRFVLYDNTTTTWIVSVIGKVLSRLNWERVELNEKLPQDLPLDSWDLLWNFQHQSFEIPANELSPYQKMNHFPGNVAFASKFYLATQTDADYIPKGFKDKETFQKYVAENPNKKFIVKHRANRGVKLVNASEVEFDKDVHSTFIGTFIQEFVERPLLWNGHKFDIAVYVAITSVNPLRVYYYDRQIALRFVRKPYSIEDPNDVDSYTVGENRTQNYDFEAIKKYLDKGFTNMDAFEDFLKSKGKTLEEIWEKIENLVRDLMIKKEKSIIDELDRIWCSKFNYFEIFRFDMMLDEDFKLYLMEVNMSPNLYADEEHFSALLPLYENIIYSFFSLVGVATNFNQKFPGEFPAEYERMILVNGTVLAVNPGDCVSDKCSESCADKCEVCWPCLIKKGWKREIIESYLEQMNSQNFKRIFPPSQKFLKSTDSFMENLTDSNKLLTKWFTGMCKKNVKFC